jgi:hypothetical protein
MQQAVKSGIQPRDVADAVKQLWKEADGPRSFAAALEAEGFILAVGRRDLVILDAAGDVHTLARCLGIKVAEIRERLAGIDRATLPTVDQAREAIRERNPVKTSSPVWSHEPAITATIEKMTGSVAGRKTDQPPANDNRPEIVALAAMLQPAKLQDDRRDPSARDNAARETMAAFGFDADSPTALAKWDELARRAEAGKITEKDRFREMALHLWHEADRDRSTGQKPPEPVPPRPPDPYRDR